MKKRVLALLCVLALLIAMVPAQVLAEDYEAPVISSIRNVSGGVQIKWDDVDAQYYLITYYEYLGEDQEVTDDDVLLVEKMITSNSYTVPKADLVSDTEYIFMVHAVFGDGDDDFTSSDPEYLYYLEAPAVTSTKNVSTGTKVTWNAVDGAGTYTVMYKQDGGTWKTAKSGITGTSYTVPTSKLTSGTKYWYTVKAADMYDGTDYSGYTSGKAQTFMATPSVTKTRNVNAGVEVTWSAVKGAKSYTVMYKENGGSWKTAKSGVTGTKYSVPKSLLKSGTKYYFTVKAVGTATSGYTSGKPQTYMTTPAVKSADKTSSGVKVTWGKVTGATSYTVMMKVSGGSWTTVKSGVTGTSYTVPKSKLTSGKTYSFTVKAKGAATSGYSSGKSLTYKA